MIKVGANNFIWIKMTKIYMLYCRIVTLKGLIKGIFNNLSPKQTAPYPNVLYKLLCSKVTHSMYVFCIT